MSGICPGPAISLIAFWPPHLLVYLVALFVGSYAGAVVDAGSDAQSASPSPDDSPAVVVGGGLAGLAAAVAVAKAGLETVHLVPKGPPDRRTSALMQPAVEYPAAARGLFPIRPPSASP